VWEVGGMILVLQRKPRGREYCIGLMDWREILRRAILLVLESIFKSFTKSLPFHITSVEGWDEGV